MHEQVKTVQDNESPMAEKDKLETLYKGEKIVNPESGHHHFVPHGQPGHVHQSMKDFAEEKKKELAQHPHSKKHPEPNQ